MQKSLIITQDNGTQELNSALSEGWRVVNTCPMPSSMAGTGGSFSNFKDQSPTCLVIIERED